MGFNRIAFILNDLVGCIEKSPKTVAYILANDISSMPEHMRDTLLKELSFDYNEPPLHEQALEVFPSFHASETKFYMAGHNCCEEVECTNKIKRGDDYYAVVKLPKWAIKNNA